MDGTEQGSSPAVESSATPSAESGASPASAGTDRGVVAEAIPAQTGGAETQDVASLQQPAAQPVVDQPLEATIQWPDEQEMRYLPGKIRDRFGNLKAGYDKLESDHKTLKGQFEPWKAVVDKYGDPAAVANDLEAIGGLRNFKFDEGGNIVFDESTGQPVYDVAPGLKAIIGQNPMMAVHLFDELLTYQDTETGETLARAFINALGISPDRLEDYRSYDPGKIAQSNSGVDPQVRADVVAKFGEQSGAVFDSLHPEMQAEFPYLQEASQRVLLDEQSARLDDRRFKDEVRKYQEEQHRQATATYDAHIQAEEDQYLGGLRDSVFDTTLSNLAEQVSISANPQINAMHTGMLRVAFSALIDSTPSVRAAVAPLLKEAGVNLDFGALDRSVTVAKQAGAQYVRLQNLANKPGYKGAPPDPRAIAQVKADAEGAAQAVGAHLAQVALRLAQGLGGQIKQQAAEVDQRLREAREARPVVTGSTSPGAPGAPVRRGAPFSRERWDGYGLNR